MGTKYTYNKGATYQSESTPITISKIPTGDYTIKVTKDNLKGEYSYTAGPGTQEITVMAKPQLVYGFRIAVNESNPYTRVTYPETIHGMKNLCYGFTPASGTGANCMNSWDGCPLITGIHRQKGNATSGWTDIANTAAWTTGDYYNKMDVMTYVPTWYMKMTNDGTYIDCAFSEKQIDSTWKDYAGSVGSNRVGHFRLGCFAGYLSDGTFHSIGTTKPTTYVAPINYISSAQARGTGYDLMTWYQWTYLIALAVLLYKSTNLRTAMARGLSYNDVKAPSEMTWSNSYGMYGSSTNTSTQMSFFWIQNMWGNIKQFIGGAKTDSNRRLMTCTGYSSTNDSDFDKTALTPIQSSNLMGYITKVTGTTDTGFFPTECNGGESIYFTDNAIVGVGYPYVGGGRDSPANIGLFYQVFGKDLNDADVGVGSRLSYRL